MPEFDDVLQTPQYRTTGDSTSSPLAEFNPSVSILDRYTVLLKDGETTATIYPIHSPNELPPGLLAFLCDEFNMEIERGDTLPFFDTLHIEQFQQYWFGSFAAVMVLGDSPSLDGPPRQWEKECLGTFSIKPNYPGRCSHICSAQFLVNAGIRGKGIGRTLTDCFLQWAPRLGYSYCMFNLVFETNVAARKLWESLNFKRIGRIKSAGVLKGHEHPVDAVIYGRDLVSATDPTVGAYRFDKIKFYLETGRYPAMADRSEKSRLRSSASHYNLEDGKLMLKGREVVGDPVRQLQICTDLHMQNHGGINKTTSLVTEKYHWVRIKDTVATAIKNCPECRDPTREIAMVKRGIPKKMSTGQPSATVTRHRINKVYSNQSRNLMRSRAAQDEVEAMVAAAQLHNLPSNRHDDLLSHELAGLDDNLIAVVEEAQRNQQQRMQKERQQQHQHSDQQQNRHVQTYAEVAAAAVANDADYQEYDYHEYSKRNNEDDIPVDPQVSSYDHGNGDEIEIARALIQANEDEHERQSNRKSSRHEEESEANMFIKDDN
ncbi:uncharacterized protein SPAPADRAFT_135403 [Spathaspora passalidarum NRRL Y-27907]|uniref:N-acetyltransferase domain-containing protein n=1 Tax=Spathaspora passalidarum (strain NRRL Y-27907 / 11-Y1) TaxID=619300 RepID=G3AJV8_SPAPN|nr:uncharacterized protein SPAPADRAFT_135403 [Spathaspora passalidarum NRRL Y-27907]EGW34009.1 hypothetical protein SPAPADRAFT_135403 [Spathaspora passalidarum NRRL Y-27907]